MERLFVLLATCAVLTACKTQGRIAADDEPCGLEPACSQGSVCAVVENEGPACWKICDDAEDACGPGEACTDVGTPLYHISLCLPE